ncbi:hypothetical protein RRG08_057729 [Elysia crispata]|uniref:Uncharacterized protein n=1 Tax=Elysia crispata TaxID=231223 RepID=A0AAE0Y8Z9_9GAST|nr:hypothetical protein RRG08_057729 [Elysia crispata]
MSSHSTYKVHTADHTWISPPETVTRNNVRVGSDTTIPSLTRLSRGVGVTFRPRPSEVRTSPESFGCQIKLCGETASRDQGQDTNTVKLSEATPRGMGSREVNLSVGVSGNNPLPGAALCSSVRACVVKEVPGRDSVSPAAIVDSYTHHRGATTPDLSVSIYRHRGRVSGIRIIIQSGHQNVLSFHTGYCTRQLSERFGSRPGEANVVLSQNRTFRSAILYNNLNTCHCRGSV